MKKLPISAGVTVAPKKQPEISFSSFLILKMLCMDKLVGTMVLFLSDDNYFHILAQHFGFFRVEHFHHQTQVPHLLYYA